MSLETFINEYRPTLNGAITSSATSITLSVVYALPLQGNCRILIESEIILITLNSTTTVVAERGMEGTTPAAHADGAPIYFIITAGTLNQSRIEQFNFDVFSNRDVNGNIGRWYRDSDGLTMARDNGTTWDNFGWCSPKIFPPSLSSLIAVGYAATTATNGCVATKSSGSANLVYNSVANGTGSYQLGAYVGVVSSSVAWTAIIGIEPNLSINGIVSTGICLYESSTGKTAIFGIQNGNGYINFEISSFTISGDTATTASSTRTNSNLLAFSNTQFDFKFYMLRYDPTHSSYIYLYTSTDGINFACVNSYLFSGFNSMSFPTHAGLYFAPDLTYTEFSSYSSVTFFHFSYSEP